MLERGGEGEDSRREGWRKREREGREGEGREEEEEEEEGEGRKSGYYPSMWMFFQKLFSTIPLKHTTRKCLLGNCTVI